MKAWEFISRDGRTVVCSWCQKEHNVRDVAADVHSICPIHSSLVKSGDWMMRTGTSIDLRTWTKWFNRLASPSLMLAMTLCGQPLPPGIKVETNRAYMPTQVEPSIIVTYAPDDLVISLAAHQFSFPSNVGLSLRYQADTNWITMTAITGVCAKISLTGSNAQYRIEMSTNLTAWTLLPHDLWTIPGSNTLYELIDSPVRYYRATKLTNQ